MTTKPEDFFERVYQVVAKIPKGRVTTYGAIARHLGIGGSARMVGWALNQTLHQKPSKRSQDREKTKKEGQTGYATPILPCHRVVNRMGELTGKAWFGGDLMEQLLRAEGVEFDDKGRVDMKRHLWEPGQDT
ncbi:MGMT family protein [Balneolaceae bacterium ANBcel3]|nr:MGMT family protein [Balneolaceae bacterium ANBcel3]